MLRFAMTLLLLAPAAVAADANVQVIAIANSESFDPDLPTLKYPAQDLERFVRVMERTGTVPPKNVHRLVGGTRAELRTLVKKVAGAAKAQTSPAKSKFVFYFTGHSDASGLHLADGLFPKDDLHDLIASVPAETRVALLDSCYSGALAAKGVKPAQAFAIPQAEFDEPSGSVFLAATSGTDVAFEVEELKGSLFTHHLVSGLYGGADVNGDGLVTIEELYQFVYRRMATGRQKPEFRVDLQGRGALILSYLDKTTSSVELAPDVMGELTFVSDNGLQIFRLYKDQPSVLKTKLVPGDYAVSFQQGDLHGEAMLRIAPAQPAELALRDFRLEKRADLVAVAKGQRPKSRLGLAVGLANGSYSRNGPHAELQVATRAVRIESSDWRAVAYLGGHRNELDYEGQTGQAKTLGLLFGVNGSVLSSFGLRGQQLHALVGGGADLMWADWERSDGEPVREFETLLPKVALGFGTSLMQREGMMMALSFRREWPFAKDKESGDVLAFGANVITLSTEW